MISFLKEAKDLYNSANIRMFIMKGREEPKMVPFGENFFDFRREVVALRDHILDIDNMRISTLLSILENAYALKILDKLESQTDYEEMDFEDIYDSFLEERIDIEYGKALLNDIKEHKKGSRQYEMIIFSYNEYLDPLRVIFEQRKAKPNIHGDNTLEYCCQAVEQEKMKPIFEQIEYYLNIEL